MTLFYTYFIHALPLAIFEAYTQQLPTVFHGDALIEALRVVVHEKQKGTVLKNRRTGEARAKVIMDWIGRRRKKMN
jgi:hypothetical protein